MMLNLWLGIMRNMPKYSLTVMVVLILPAAERAGHGVMH